MLWILFYLHLQAVSSLAVKCPEGMYLGRDSDQGCVKCPSGTYQPSRDSKYCIECKRGTYSTGIGVSSPLECKNCASGTYAVNGSGCVLCPPFTTSPQGAFRVSECRSKPGYYSEPGTSGLGCPANHFCHPGTTSPTRCPSGAFSRPLSYECKPLWKHWGGFNWMLWVVWCFMFCINVSCFTLNASSNSKHTQHSRCGEIQIKINP
jgi:hypothetical protein